jgi:hypothetical protein
MVNEGQTKFYYFILERVQDDKKAEAQALLGESFTKQADGTFTPEYIRTFIPKMLALLKPEYTEEVKSIMTNFGQGK